MSATETDSRRQIIQDIQRRLAQVGADAYLPHLASNIHYATGYRSYFVGEWWRFFGFAFALVPTDPASGLAIVAPAVEEASAREAEAVSDVRTFSMWMETRGLDEVQQATPVDDRFLRPSWHDQDAVDDAVRSILGDRGLLSGRIACDLRFMPVALHQRLVEIAPEVTWIDFTEAIWSIRAVKHPFEIGHLRRAQELLDAGLNAVGDSLHVGMTSGGVGRTFQRGVIDAVEQRPNHFAGYSDQWMITSVGSEGKIAVAEGTRGAQPGELVKFDGGVTVGGYIGDGGRTFSIGEPAPHKRRLYEALKEANARVVEQLLPGRPVCAAFEAAERYMHDHGYPSYLRGQYGHSIGLEHFPEEPPFISRDEQRPVEEGMVFAVETPYYGSDIGSIMIEDLWLVEVAGPTCLNALSRELIVL